MDEASPIRWDGERPISRRYGDVYFSREDGLAEARAVFLAGCGLPEAWRGRSRFTVGELGFGTGLNIAALIALWREARPPGAHLSLFSIEADPPSRDDAARALAAWPEIAGVSARLIDRWPRRARGFHRASFEDLGVTLDLAMMPVGEALEAWSGKADAWFLDGFAPATNPEMWTDAVLAGVAARSRPGARAATYTVAGAVRRGLEAAGFTLERQPGFGRKRERLEARLNGVAADAPAPRSVAIVGAGIAGAALAQAFAAQGVTARVFASSNHAAASAAPAALVAPRLDAGLGPVAQLAAQSVHRALDLYAAVPGALVAQGAVQHVVQAKDLERFRRVAGSDLFESGAVVFEPAEGALALAVAAVVEPRVILEAWAPQATSAEVAAIKAVDGGFQLIDTDLGVIAEAQAVVVAGGAEASHLLPGLPLRPVRGQASMTGGVDLDRARLFGAYALPTRDGLMFGATHDRDDTGLEVRPEDHARNLEALRRADPVLGEEAGSRPLEAYVGIRAATPDFLPLAGLAAQKTPGLFVLGGLGSRGFTVAPLLAEHVVALALGLPSPLPTALAEIVDPARFQRRRERRGGR